MGGSKGRFEKGHTAYNKGKTSTPGNTYYVVCIDSRVKSIPLHAHIDIMHCLHVFFTYFITVLVCVVYVLLFDGVGIINYCRF